MRVFAWIFVVVLLFVFVPKADAQTVKAASDVQAAVGDFFVTFSGLASPFASIVITTDGQIVRSTTADATGRWSIAQARVKQGFSSFCISVIDFKRLGETEACMEVSPIYKSSTIQDIFLPPTIGLYKKQVRVGQEAIIWGYSMPGAQVTIRINQTQTVIINADNTGYYEYRFKADKAGKYSLKATAQYNNLTSLEPTKEVILEAQTIPQEAVNRVKEGLGRLRDLFSSTIFGFITVVTVLASVTLMLLRKLYPGLFPAFYVMKHRKKKPLHDDWLIHEFPIS